MAEEVGSGGGSSDCAGQAGPDSVVLGIGIAVVASVGINLGQNLQALGLQSSEEAVARPCSSRTWVIGLTIFITGSLLNFAAFSFAAASVVVPIEAVQFVTNVRLCARCRRPPLSHLSAGVVPIGALLEAGQPGNGDAPHVDRHDGRGCWHRVHSHVRPEHESLLHAHKSHRALVGEGMVRPVSTPPHPPCFANR